MITARIARMCAEGVADETDPELYEELVACLTSQIMERANDGKYYVEVTDTFKALAESCKSRESRRAYEYTPEKICKYAAELLVSNGFQVEEFQKKDYGADGRCVCETCRPAVKIMW